MKIINQDAGMTTKQKILTGLVGAILAPAIVAAIAYGTYGGEPEKVADLSDKIQDVQEWPLPNEKPELYIFFVADRPFTTKRFMTDISEDMSIWSRRIEKHWPGKYSSILWFVRARTTDRSGNEGEALAFKLGYKMSDIKGVNWNEITPESFLNYATIEQLNLIGRDYAVSYCSDKDNVLASIEFCADLANRIIK